MKLLFWKEEAFLGIRLPPGSWDGLLAATQTITSPASALPD